MIHIGMCTDEVINPISSVVVPDVLNQSLPRRFSPSIDHIDLCFSIFRDAHSYRISILLSLSHWDEINLVARERGVIS